MGTYTEITVTVPDSVGEDQINDLFWRVIQVAQSFEESHLERDWDASVSAISGQKWDEDDG